LVVSRLVRILVFGVGDAGSPRLMRVREPNHLRVERADWDCPGFG
jgi:hypothetical protein